MPFRHEFGVVGRVGSLFLADPWHAVAPVVELHRNGQVERIPTGPANAFLREVENLCAAIRGEAEPLLGRADALGQARALDALLHSAEAGDRSASPFSVRTLRRPADEHLLQIRRSRR